MQKELRPLPRRLLDDPVQLRAAAVRIRRNIVEMLGRSGSGHPGGSLSSADIMAVLYMKEMNVRPEEPTWPGRDRFVLSKGHAAPVLYAALAEAGFLPADELLTLRQWGSRLQGHPDMRSTPGVDMSTGSLGQGLSAACGMAIAAKMDGAPWRVYALVGDGELQEGQIWEAAMTAVHQKLDNLTAIVDLNGLQIDGPTVDVKSLRDVAARFTAFGWHVIEIDGHDIPAIMEAFAAARDTKGLPTCIVASTVKGKGVSFMENQAAWHGTAPKPEQVAAALGELIEAAEVRN